MEGGGSAFWSCGTRALSAQAKIHSICFSGMRRENAEEECKKRAHGAQLTPLQAELVLRGCRGDTRWAMQDKALPTGPQCSAGMSVRRKDAQTPRLLCTDRGVGWSPQSRAEGTSDHSIPAFPPANIPQLLFRGHIPTFLPPSPHHPVSRSLL